LEYDGILLGAGHNCLILQAYLGLAGLRTICLERRHDAGGGLCTMEDPRYPGFLHNTHSFFHRAIRQMPWFHDLDLEKRGAHYIEPDRNVVLLQRNGDSLDWWTDFERTFESFARISAKDARTLKRWRDEFLPILDDILVPESLSPPLPPQMRLHLLEKTADGRRLLEVSRFTPLDFVRSEFENTVVQAGLLFFNGLREVDPRTPGFGHHIPALLASRHKAQMCLGGSASLAQALIAAVTATGGEIRLNTAPRKIHVENGAVRGVETTTSGQFIRCRNFIASGLNPLQTFLELLDADAIPDDWRRKAANFQFNLLGPLFALHLNLKNPPRYPAAGKRSESEQPFMTILGLENASQFTGIVRSHEQGTIPETVMWGACPTQFDSSQAPAGMHTAFMWEKLPYKLRGDPENWDREKDAHARKMIDLWAAYAPNLRESVIDYFARSPLDTERSLLNMREGDLLVGALSNGQTGFNRPFAGAGQYRGYVGGLYLCGGSSYPGGNVTGLPGYNCAQTLLHDLGLPADWAPMPVEQRLARLARES
jgi:phytoene dehydrogenase-like protein